MHSSLKGIVLAGGYGTRLFPLTKAISKQLLPIYDKPMVYYALSILFLANVKEICIITNPYDLEKYNSILGDGSRFGAKFTYVTQPNPDGIASAFRLANSFLGDSSCYLILGDNLFYGDSFGQRLQSIPLSSKGCTIFTHEVNNPSRYGVVEFENNQVSAIKEKPIKTNSQFALTGLYYFDKQAKNFTKSLKKSKRGEYEITSLCEMYLNKKCLSYEKLGRGFTWFDAGTHESLLESSQFIQSIQHRQGKKIGCLEEIALINRWINKEKILETIKESPKSEYIDYLRSLVT